MQHEHKPATPVRYSGFITLHACACHAGLTRMHCRRVYYHVFFIIIIFRWRSDLCMCFVFTFFFCCWNIMKCCSWRQTFVKKAISFWWFCASDRCRNPRPAPPHCTFKPFHYFFHLFFFCLCVCFFPLPRQITKWMIWSFRGVNSRLRCCSFPHARPPLCELNV